MSKKSVGSFVGGFLGVLIAVGALSAIAVLLPPKNDNSNDDSEISIPIFDSGSTSTSVNEEVEYKDYYKYDLSTSVNGRSLNAKALNDLFGLDDDIVGLPLKEFVEDGEQNAILFEDKGGIRLGAKTSSGKITFAFRDGVSFEYLNVTAKVYSNEVYVDPDNGVNEPILDDDGNKIVQYYAKDTSSLCISLKNDEFEEIGYGGYDLSKKDNDREVTAFEQILDYELEKSIFSLYNENGRVIITAMEFYNGDYETAKASVN